MICTKARKEAKQATQHLQSRENREYNGVLYIKLVVGERSAATGFAGQNKEKIILILDLLLCVLYHSYIYYITDIYIISQIYTTSVYHTLEVLSDPTLTRCPASMNPSR